MTINVKYVITKMCEVIGVKYDDVDFTNHRWFLEYSWTREEEEEFRDWLITLIEKTTIDTRHYAEVQANFFILNYGWATKEK